MPGFSKATWDLEHNATFFAFSSTLGIMMGAHIGGFPMNAWMTFWAYALGSQTGLLIPGAHFNPGTSFYKFLCSGCKDPMKLLCRFVGQLTGAIVPVLAIGVMTWDAGKTGFFYPQLSPLDDLKWWNALIAATMLSGPAYWLLDAYGDDIISKRIAHFITYGYQASFGYGICGVYISWNDAVARGIGGMIWGNGCDGMPGTTGTNNGVAQTVANCTGNFDAGDWIEALWVIIVGGGILGPLFGYVFKTFLYGDIAVAIEAEAEDLKNEESFEETGGNAGL